MVADIKKNENNPLLAQLIMNRRHLIFNGMISILMVSQKYSLIPARLRSNASWLVFFKLNPLDVENINRDMVTLETSTYYKMIDWVFGTDAQKLGCDSCKEAIKNKKYDNMGIWCEYDIYFKNF